MKKLLVLLPSVLLYFLFIVLIDPNFLFSSEDEKISQSIVDGNSVFVFKKVETYRNLKKCIIERMPKNTECVVVGPSTSLVFDSQSVGSSSFYNLSITHGSFQDTLAILGILEANDVNYKKLVLNLDNFFFDSKADQYVNTDFIKPYADYMSSLVLDGKDHKSRVHPDYAALLSSKVDALFSVSYFQDSWRYLSSRKLHALTRRWGIVDSGFAGDDFSYGSGAVVQTGSTEAGLMFSGEVAKGPQTVLALKAGWNIMGNPLPIAMTFADISANEIWDPSGDNIQFLDAGGGTKVREDGYQAVYTYLNADWASSMSCDVGWYQVDALMNDGLFVKPDTEDNNVNPGASFVVQTGSTESGVQFMAALPANAE